MRRKVVVVVICMLLCLILSACAGQRVRDANHPILIQIISSNEKFISTISQGNIISDRIALQVKDKLRKKGIESSVKEIQNSNKLVLLIEYEYLETDTIPNGPFGIRNSVLSMRGNFKLIEPKTEEVLLNEKFDESEDKISQFEVSISDAIVKRVAKYF